MAEPKRRYLVPGYTKSPIVSTYGQQLPIRVLNLLTDSASRNGNISIGEV